MSISDAFFARHSDFKPTVHDDDDIPLRISVFEGTNYASRSYNLLNPRQTEFYMQQKAHQERLNYLHFKYRLNNQENSGTNDEFDFSNYYRNSSRLNKTMPISMPDDEDSDDEASADLIRLERKLAQEELELQKELKRQQSLLTDTQTKLTEQIDRIKLLLEKFRREREISMKNLENEYSQRKERYKTDITTIKNTEVKKPEINISIVKEKNYKSTKKQHSRRKKNSTEMSSTIMDLSSPSFQSD